MLKQIIFSPVCIDCGSLCITESLFCKPCLSKLLKRQTALQSHLELEHAYLFDWDHDDFLIRELVYRLKSNLSSAAWECYAFYFYSHYKNTNLFDEVEYLIPIPGSNEKSVHSLLFVKGLSRLTEIPILQPLRKINTGKQQKHKTASERKASDLMVAESTQMKPFSNILFVDDVLATGSTYNQAKKALNLEGNCGIITLFYRTRKH